MQARHNGSNVAPYISSGTNNVITINGDGRYRQRQAPEQEQRTYRRRGKQQRAMFSIPTQAESQRNLHQQIAKATISNVIIQSKRENRQRQRQTKRPGNIIQRRRQSHQINAGQRVPQRQRGNAGKVIAMYRAAIAQRSPQIPPPQRTTASSNNTATTTNNQNNNNNAAKIAGKFQRYQATTNNALRHQ